MTEQLVKLEGLEYDRRYFYFVKQYEDGLYVCTAKKKNMFKGEVKE